MFKIYTEKDIRNHITTLTALPDDIKAYAVLDSMLHKGVINLLDITRYVNSVYWFDNKIDKIINHYLDNDKEGLDYWTIVYEDTYDIYPLDEKEKEIVKEECIINGYKNAIKQRDKEQKEWDKKYGIVRGEGFAKKYGKQFSKLVMDEQTAKKKPMGVDKVREAEENSHVFDALAQSQNKTAEGKTPDGKALTAEERNLTKLYDEEKTTLKRYERTIYQSQIFKIIVNLDGKRHVLSYNTRHKKFTLRNGEGETLIHYPFSDKALIKLFEGKRHLLEYFLLTLRGLYKNG